MNPGGTWITSLFFDTMNSLRQVHEEVCCLARVVVVTEVHNLDNLRT
jgi:hypothetical protein